MTILRKAVTATGIVGGLGLAFAFGCSSNSEKSKERRWRRFSGYAANQDEVIDSFVEYIRNDSRNNLKSFQNRRRADSEAALTDLSCIEETVPGRKICEGRSSQTLALDS
jgi:hypothetical protein